MSVILYVSVSLFYGFVQIQTPSALVRTANGFASERFPGIYDTYTRILIIVLTWNLRFSLIDFQITC